MKSYIKYYSNLNVNFVKIEQNQDSLPVDLQEAYDKRATFNSNTVLFNDFTTELDALYFPPNSEFSSNICSIYRKTYSQQYYNYVCALQGEVAFKDYNIHNNDYYKYMAVIGVPQSNGSYTYKIYDNRDDEGEEILTRTKWDGWSICNIEETDETPDARIYAKTGDTWLLGLNMEGENLTQNMSVTSWDTLGKYPKVFKGAKNYESSTFTGLLGNIKKVIEPELKSVVVIEDDVEKLVKMPVTTCRYTERINSYPEGTTQQEIENLYKEKSDNPRSKNSKWLNIEEIRHGREVEKYQAWKEFCNDGELKLLKDIKGNSWIVHIIDNPSNNIANNAHNMPTTISFSWKEVLNVEDISIIEKVE